MVEGAYYVHVDMNKKFFEEHKLTEWCSHMVLYLLSGARTWYCILDD